MNHSSSRHARPFALASSARSWAARLLVGASLVGAVACSGSEEEPVMPAEDTSVTFVGKLSTSSAAVAVVTGTKVDASGASEAAVYLCDGVKTSTWYFGAVKAGVIDAQNSDGKTFHGTVAGEAIAGQIETPDQGAVDVSVSRATGVAGLYLVKHAGSKADGFSSENAHLEGEFASDANGMTATGTLTPSSGAPIAFSGKVQTFGDSEGAASWIVQADGSVHGSVSNTAGGGNCSVWKKIASLVNGVYCGYIGL